MLKWALTSKHPPTKCGYYKTNNIDRKEELDLEFAELILIDARKANNKITLFGGEPTVAEQFGDKVQLANKLFDEVYLATQNREVLGSTELSSYFDAITFSSHREQLPIVQIKTPVYLSVLANEFSYELFEDAINKGFTGLTINEDQRSGERFDGSKLDNIKYLYAIANRDKNNIKKVAQFSIRVNRADKCVNDGEIIILPDLEQVEDFSEFL